MRPFTAVILIAIILGVIVAGALLAVALQGSGSHSSSPNVTFSTSSVPAFNPLLTTSGSASSYSTFSSPATSSAYSPTTATFSSLSSTSVSTTQSSTAVVIATSTSTSSSSATNTTFSTTSTQSPNISIVLAGSLNSQGPPPYPQIQVGLAASGSNNSLKGLLGVFPPGPFGNSVACLEANVTGSINSNNGFTFGGRLYIPNSVPPPFICAPSILALSGQTVTFTANYSTYAISMAVPNSSMHGPGSAAINFTGSATTFRVL